MDSLALGGVSDKVGLDGCGPFKQKTCHMDQYDACTIPARAEYADTAANAAGQIVAMRKLNPFLKVPVDTI